MIDASTIQNIIITTAFVGAGISNGLDWVKKNRPKNRNAKHVTTAKEEARDLRIRLQHRYGCQVRINTWQFTNGKTSIGIEHSFKHGEILFQEFSDGLAKLPDDYCNLKVIDFDTFVNDLADAPKYMITKVSDLKELERVQVYEMMGTKQVLDFKFVQRNVYAGFLSIGFSEEVNLRNTGCPLEFCAQDNEYCGLKDDSCMIKEIEKSVIKIKNNLKG